MYIILEGCDGCGKDSQAVLLREQLRDQGHDPLMIAEPYEETETGQLLRKYLKGHTHPEALFGLFIANRFDLQREVINPALDRGQPVVSVRGFPSTLVYQQDKYDLEFLIRMHEFMPVFPTHVIILDVDVPTAWDRLNKRGSELEVFEKKDFLQRCRNRYLSAQLHTMMLNSFGISPIVIDATQSITDTFNSLWDSIKSDL